MGKACLSLHDMTYFSFGKFSPMMLRKITKGYFFFLKAHVIYKGIHEKGLGDVVSVVFFVVFYKIFVFSDTL